MQVYGLLLLQAEDLNLDMNSDSWYTKQINSIGMYGEGIDINPVGKDIIKDMNGLQHF